MISTQKIKQELNKQNLNISDEEAAEIKNTLYDFSELIFESWELDKLKNE